MSFEDLKMAMAASGTAKFGCGASEIQIEHAEQQLGLAIRGDYRRFLAEFGWCSVGPHELCGLGADVPPFLDLVTLTIGERTDAQLRPELLPVMNNGGGDHHCLDLASEGPRVVFWDHTLGADQEPAVEAPDFSAWFQEMLRNLD
jgi:hypothetical protein